MIQINQLLKKILNEMTGSDSSKVGSFVPPIQPGLHKFEKSQLGPYIEAVSEFDSPELAHDSYDGKVHTPKSKAKKIEKKAERGRNYVEKNFDYYTVGEDIDKSDDLLIYEDDIEVWGRLLETTYSGGAGAYKVPMSPGLKLWDKSSLGPYIEKLSKYINSELQYDSYDGIMDSKNIKTKEHIARKISKNLKKHLTNQDDSGLGAGRVGVSFGGDGGGESGDGGGVSESLINKNVLVEDLAVWFGTKKKPKGSKQPKGPWVNICRKVNGKHPPCGRPDTSKGAYPKCRAAGVAGKMSDSQKKAACAQKRRAEKSDTQSGKGQKPVMTSYKIRKESINKKKVITEKFKVESNEYNKLFDENDFLLVVPYTHDASCKYGANTKWCTTSEDDTMFKKHNRMGSLGYLIVKDKDLQKKLGSEKFGLYMNKPGANFLGGNYPGPDGLIFYDERNDILTPNQIMNLFDRYDLYGRFMTIIRKFVTYSFDKFKKMDSLEDNNS